MCRRVGLAEIAVGGIFNSLGEDCGGQDEGGRKANGGFKYAHGVRRAAFARWNCASLLGDLFIFIFDSFHCCMRVARKDLPQRNLGRPVQRLE